MQSEVRCQDAQRRTVAVEDNVKRRARLVPRDSEIDRLHRLYAMSGQQRIAVIAMNRMRERRPGDSVQARTRAQVFEHVESRGSELHLLEGDDVGVQLLQH